MKTRIGKAAVVLFGLLVAASSAQAASFDCAKASTKIEKMICDDKELSKLDEELSAEYKAATKGAKQATSVKQAQRKWIKWRNGCADASCVKSAYEAQLQAIRIITASSNESDSSQDDNCYACPRAAEAYLIQKQTAILAALSKEDAGLFDAVEEGNKTAAEKWLTKGANANAEKEAMPEYMGGGHFDEGKTFTPLHVATKNNNKEIVELLLTKGANINARGEEGTPLHYAVFYGTREIVELLLAKGADVNARTVDDLTPLHLAAGGGRKEIAELLIAKGADVNARDSQGNTPLVEATRNEHKGIVSVLKAHGAKE